MFNKDELLEYLDDTASEAILTGATKSQAKKITKKAFTTWLSDYTSTLKEQIRANEVLDPNKKEYRKKRQKKDFHFFRNTYFPHYFTLEGKSGLQENLEQTYYKIVDPNKLFPLSFAKAAPRANGKSTDASLAFPIWCIVNDFKKFITIFSDAIELTETLIEAIKAELEENPQLLADFPEMMGATKNWKIGDIVTANGIRIKGYGSAKKVRGVKHGVYRVDLAIIDDLENDTNVKSRRQRDKLEEWLDEAVENLGGANGTMDILYIGTILHRDSVLNRKLKLKFWHPVIFRTLISYPTNMEMWEEYGELFRHVSIDDAHNYYMENKALMDKGAVRLWDAISLEYIMQKRAKNNKAFQKEQQNNPNSENQKFDSSTFEVISHTQMPKLDRVFFYVDAKGDSMVGDYCGFIGAGINNTTMKMYVFYSKQKRIKGKPVVIETIELLKKFKVDLLSGDKNGGFYMLRDWIKDEAFRQGVPMPSTKFIHHTQNKEDRMGELEFPIDEKDIVFVGRHTELFAQMDDFPEADHDDLHDPLSAIYQLSKLRRLKKDSNSPRGGKRTNTRHIRARRNGRR
ncbi:hypothetical protein [Sulfurimonas sp.]|uniref:hypothetical protein n=1 Tax=Sulfurimonas sp. TaxID=2022749 RepID=UPI0025F09BC7|nr:hypothetical protein [Sulfurimonas sp.]